MTTSSGIIAGAGPSSPKMPEFSSPSSVPTFLQRGPDLVAAHHRGNDGMHDPRRERQLDRAVAEHAVAEAQTRVPITSVQVPSPPS